MKFTKVKWCILLFAVGFIFISADLYIDTGVSFPKKYDNSDSVIGEFQYYTIASAYGARCTYKMIDDQTGKDSYTSVKVIDDVFFKNIRIDILNDFAGFILILIACVILRSGGRSFYFAAACSIFSVILHGIIVGLPYITNGLSLCYAAMLIGFAYAACTVLTTFFVMKGLLGLCGDVCCRDERKWCRILWFAYFAMFLTTVFIFWIGADFGALKRLGQFFEIAIIIVIIAFWAVLGRTCEYISRALTSGSTGSK